jgi:hypothetical protein
VVTGPGRAGIVVLALALCGSGRAAPVDAPADYLAALALYRQGQVSRAYGRFVALAESGHAPSARQALWMCEHGLTRFGRSWDCAPHEIEDWAALIGESPAEALGRIYPSVVRARSAGRSAR